MNPFLFLSLAIPEITLVVRNLIVALFFVIQLFFCCAQVDLFACACVESFLFETINFSF
jgi:hypothetical protein